MRPAGIPRLMRRHDDELYDCARGFWITRLHSPFFSVLRKCGGAAEMRHSTVWCRRPTVLHRTGSSLTKSRPRSLRLAQRHVDTRTHMHYHTRSLCFRACVRQGCLYNKRKFAGDWLQQSLTLHTGLRCLLFGSVFTACGNGSDHKMNYMMVR